MVIDVSSLRMVEVFSAVLFQHSCLRVVKLASLRGLELLGLKGVLVPSLRGVELPSLNLKVIQLSPSLMRVEVPSLLMVSCKMVGKHQTLFPLNLIVDLSSSKTR